MLARRKVLKLLGLAPTASLAAKLANDDRIAKEVGGLRSWPKAPSPASSGALDGRAQVEGPFSNYAPEFNSAGPTYEQIKVMLGGKEFRDSLEGVPLREGTI